MQRALDVSLRREQCLYVALRAAERTTRASGKYAIAVIDEAEDEGSGIGREEHSDITHTIHLANLVVFARVSEVRSYLRHT